jgi:DNA invertase Pin-like site-specific DNA recombinase
MRIGYARGSTQDQNLDLQRDALKQVGCDKIIEDTASGGKAQRSGLDRVRELLRAGDVLVVWRLDRLGRSLQHLIELLTELEHAGIGFQSITEAIDTTTPGGKLVFHIFGAQTPILATRQCSLDLNDMSSEAAPHRRTRGANRLNRTTGSRLSSDSALFG